jgi:hypothetical protein
MKTRSVLILSALFAIGSIAFAQGPQGGQGGQGGRMGRSSSERAKSEVTQLTEALSLTTEQATKVLEVSLKYAKKDSVSMSAMRESGSFDRDAMMKLTEESTKAKTAELNTIFTADQKNKYTKYLEDAAARRQQMMGGGGQMGGGAPN